MARGKTILVLLASDEPARCREALRAALGLGLRGDSVAVRHCLPLPVADPEVDRAIGTLARLGWPVEPLSSPAALDRAVATADAVEVWR